MRRGLWLLALAITLSTLAAPGIAHAGTGSTIFQRFWDSMVTTWKNRTESEAPVWLTLIEQGEEIFLGDTADLTELPAVQDAVAAARVAGGILLAFCIVISLGEVTAGHVTGGGQPLAAWFWRLTVATVMTFGSLPITGAIVRFCNYLLYEVRTYLDMHFTDATTADLWMGMVSVATEGAHILISLVFLAVLFILLLLLWFLYGGVRVAEVIIHMLLWPLTWPLYLLPSLEDIPKTATRAFVMWAALPIMVVLMLRTAIRMVIGSSLWGTIWAFVPALCLLGMTLFLPGAVRRVFGQGHTGTGLITTAARVIAGLKFAAVAGAAGGAAALAAGAPAGGAAAAPATPMRPLPLPGIAGGSLQPYAAAPPSDAGGIHGPFREVPGTEGSMPLPELEGDVGLFPAIAPAATARNYRLIAGQTRMGAWGVMGRQYPHAPAIEYIMPPEDFPGRRIALEQNDSGIWEPVAEVLTDGSLHPFGPGDDTSNLPRIVPDPGPVPESPEKEDED